MGEGMGTASVPPTTEARDVFRSLGYTVEERGAEFVAVRKWRRVLVTPVRSADATGDPDRIPDPDPGDPRLRCFVTWAGGARQLRDGLRSTKPPYDWAVIAIDDAGSFEVMRGAPASP